MFSPPSDPWQYYDRPIAFHLSGDNETVVNWINGVYACTEATTCAALRSLAVGLHKAWCCELIAPKNTYSNWCRHVYREFNSRADALATRGVLDRRGSHTLHETPHGKPFLIRCAFDGGRRDSEAASGWWLEGSWVCEGQEPSWTTIAEASVYLGDVGSDVAELIGAVEVISASLSFVRTGQILFDDLTRVQGSLG